MFTAVLIAFAIQVGSGNELAPAMTVTPFETMEQCEVAKELLDVASDTWTYKGGKKIDVMGKISCHKLPAVPVIKQTNEVPTCENTEPVAAPVRTHKRWD